MAALIEKHDWLTGYEDVIKITPEILDDQITGDEVMLEDAKQVATSVVDRLIAAADNDPQAIRDKFIQYLAEVGNHISWWASEVSQGLATDDDGITAMLQVHQLWELRHDPEGQKMLTEKWKAGDSNISRQSMYDLYEDTVSGLELVRRKDHPA